MIETLPLLLADAAATLSAIYWICLIVGGGLLVISMLGVLGHADADVGDFDADAEFDVDADVGHVDVDHADGFGHDAHSIGELATWFSIRFVIYFVAAFGAIGVILTGLTDTTTWWALGWAIIAGIVVGQGVHQTFRAIRRNSGNSLTTEADYLDKPARVSVRINPPATGEVVVHVLSRDTYVPARSKRPDAAFTTGDQVVIVGYSGGVAEVVSQEEYDFMKKS